MADGLMPGPAPKCGVRLQGHRFATCGVRNPMFWCAAIQRRVCGKHRRPGDRLALQSDCNWDEREEPCRGDAATTPSPRPDEGNHPALMLGGSSVGLDATPECAA